MILINSKNGENIRVSLALLRFYKWGLGHQTVVWMFSISYKLGFIFDKLLACKVRVLYLRGIGVLG